MKTKLLLRAFGESEALTLHERTEIILNVQNEISSILQHYEWALYNKKTVVVNIKDRENAYPLVFTQVKKGLNAKVAKPIRYKEEDIAGISSSCNFYESKNLTKGAIINYRLGYPAKAFDGFMFGIENINESMTFSKEQLQRIIELIVVRFKPLFLSLVEEDFFHNISKASENELPWTGCLTYVSNKVTETEIPKKFKAVPFKGLGQIVYTYKDDPYGSYIVDRDLALELEQFFIDNNIRASKRKAKPNPVQP